MFSFTPNQVTIAIVGLFFLATLILGLATKRAKTLKEYALANRKFSTGVLTLTLLATFVGSGDFNNPYHTFRDGVIHQLESVFFIIAFYLIGIFIAPYMIHFRDCITTGDVIGKLHGRVARIVTGLIGICFSLLMVSAQIRAIGEIASGLIDITPPVAIIAIGLAVVIYSALGGMRAVTITDIVQFTALAVALVVMTNALLYKVGGLEVLFKKLPSEKLAVLSNESFYYKMSESAFWGLFPAFLLSPPIIQRMLMARHKGQAKNMFFTAATLYGIIRVLLTLIGLCTVLYCENDNLREIPSNLFPYLTKKLFVANGIIYIILLIGFLCILVSTIDSYLLAAGISILQDVIKPIRQQKISNSANEIKLVRISVVGVGFLAIVLGLQPDPFGHASYYYAVLVSAIFIVPFISGVIGFESNAKSFWAFTVPYSTMIVLTKFMGVQEYLLFFISLAVGIIAFFVHHYITYRGFAWIDRDTDLLLERRWKPSWAQFTRACYRLVTSPLRIASIARKKVANYGSEPLLFSLFIVIINMVVNCTGQAHPMYSFMLAGGVNVVGTLLCTGLMLQSVWPGSLKKYFDLYWFIAVGYCVPFSNILLFLDDPSNSTAVIKLTVMIFMLGLLVDRRSFITLMLLGAVCAFGVYRVLTSSWMPSLDFSTKWALCWGVGLAALTSLLFSRKK